LLRPPPDEDHATHQHRTDEHRPCDTAVAVVALRPEDPAAAGRTAACEQDQLSAARRGQHCTSDCRSGPPLGLAAPERPSKRWEEDGKHRRPLAGDRSTSHPANDLAIRDRCRYRVEGSARSRGNAPADARLVSPKSKRAQPRLGTTAFVLLPAWAALSQRRRSSTPPPPAPACALPRIQSSGRRAAFTIHFVALRSRRSAGSDERLPSIAITPRSAAR